MEQQGDWIAVERNEFDDKEIDGRSMVVRISVSPYDVPHHVRGAFDADKQRFVIEFKYVDREPTKSVKAGTHAIAEIGKHSGRIYSLEIDSKALRVETIGLEMKSKADSAMRDLVSTMAPERARKRNYALAQSVIDTYWTPLTQLFAGMTRSSTGAIAR